MIRIGLDSSDGLFGTESMMESPRSIVNELRKYGTCVLFERKCEGPLQDADLFRLVDGFVAGLGFVGLGEQWTKVGRDDAIAILQHILRKDMAYGVRTMPHGKALQLAQEFIGIFSDDARYFTNGNFILRVPNSGSNITDSTFDSGIVCVDTDRLGILWLEADD